MFAAQLDIPVIDKASKRQLSQALIQEIASLPTG
jgi:hypothetical protein